MAQRKKLPSKGPIFVKNTKVAKKQRGQISLPQGPCKTLGFERKRKKKPPIQKMGGFCCAPFRRAAKKMDADFRFSLWGPRKTLGFVGKRKNKEQ